MCLIAKEKEPRLADENLKCYKILDDAGTQYKTPWQRYFVNDDIVNGKETMKPEPSSTEPENQMAMDGTIGQVIRDGFIHSIDGYENAVVIFGIIKRLFPDLIKNPVLFECEIPSGTEYFEGIDNNNYKGFASKELKFIKRVDAELKEAVEYEGVSNQP